MEDKFLTKDQKEKIHKYTDKLMNDFMNVDLSQDTEQDFFKEDKEIEKIIDGFCFKIGIINEIKRFN